MNPIVKKIGVVAILATLLLLLTRKTSKAMTTATTVISGKVDEVFDAPSMYNQKHGRTVNKTVPAVMNNNPGNLKWFGATWQGLNTNLSKMNSWCVFNSVDYGARAMGKLIQNYIKGGTDTISAIVYKYAPPTDKNPTSKYALFVSDSCGMDLNEKIAPSDLEKIAHICYYMHIFEAGFSWVSYFVFLDEIQKL